MRSGIARVEVEVIEYRSGKKISTRSNSISTRLILDQLDRLLDRFPTASRPPQGQFSTRSYTSVFDMSKILGKEARPMPTKLDRPDHSRSLMPTKLDQYSIA